MPNYLFGPVAPGFPTSKLDDCVFFDLEGRQPFSVDANGDWESLMSKLPAGWRPDFLVLWLSYTSIPPWLWKAPVPVIGLAPDWNLQWHAFRRLAPLCDLVFTDRPGVGRFREFGLDHVREANLFGLDPSFAEGWSERQRDIDVLFVGNVHRDVQGGRNPWLNRIAQLGPRRKVVIRAGAFGPDYRGLLGRAKLVFNRSVRDECNMRAFEAAAAGALLLQERGNEEVPLYLRPGSEFVTYDEGDLERFVEHYLDNEAERAAISAAARARAGEHTFPALWGRVLDTIANEKELVEARCRKRLAGELDPGFCQVDLVASGATNPAEAAEKFRQVLSSDVSDIVASANLAVALARDGKRDEAVEQATRTLAALAPEDLPAVSFDAPLYPPGYDNGRVEWERAAWQHAGDPDAECLEKRRLLLARMHSLLADLTGGTEHYAAAAEACPESPTARAAFGCALARLDRQREAIPHLKAAADAAPFDRAAARALYQCLLDAGETAEAERLAESRRRLALAAPGLVPPEPWFAPPPAKKQVITLTPREFSARFGDLDTSRAICGFTGPADTCVVLTLLAHSRARRVLEVGTAAGHMTANLTEWTGDDAVVYTMGDVTDVPAGRAGGQAYETPPRAVFGRHADHFGKAHKVLFVTADSLHYDFGRLAPLDFVFVDGAHDFEHVLSDTRKAYAALAPGGWLCWHDFGSRTPWVEVDRAIAAAGLSEPVGHVLGTQVAFLQKAPAGPARRRPGEAPLAVAWEGDVEEVHSLASVNRNLVERLTHRGHFVSVRPSGRVPAGKLPGPHPAGRLVGRPLPRRADVTVRHGWPADFSASAEGKLVVIQPWEFGPAPRSWVAAVNGGAVAEVWVPSNYVRDGFVQSGMPASKIHVVPNGVDVAVFRPGLPPYPLKTAKKFRLLFVGGTIWRKGFEVLLEAYGRAFTSADDVCLVVKDMGVGTFYRGQTAGAALEEFRTRPGAPEIEYLSDDLSDGAMAALYSSCHCLVLPFRGEGFGMPVTEAMACGLPVVVTDHGPVRDWCDPSNSFLVPARQVRFGEKRVGDEETVDYPTLAEPDPDALAATLRHVHSQPAEAAAKARAGCATVRGRLTWDRAAAAAEHRLRQLARPVAPSASAPGKRPKVSLTMIVRNEEKNLPDCLRSVAGLVDEIVVADTGSTDRTVEVARSFGARVIETTWPDSFAAARNVALEQATGEWVFWMDADDRLDAANAAKLRDLFASLGGGNEAYVMKCLCVAAAPGETATSVDHVRLFRNDPRHRWKYRVHEQILPSVRGTRGEVKWSDLVILHTGYTDPAVRRRKLERDLNLLRLEEAENPDDPFNLFNIGSVYHEMGRPKEALEALRRSLQRSNPRDSIVRKLYALIVQCHRDLGDADEAARACAEGRAVYPEDAELLFIESLLLREKGDRKGAEERLTRLLNGKEDAHFASVDTGLRGYKARHNLAVLCLEQQRHAEAIGHWLKATEEEPDFFPAQAGLGEAYARTKNWDGLEAHAERLARFGSRGEEEGLFLLGLGKMHAGELAAARYRLATAAERFPDSMRIRRLLAQVTLQEGKDLAAAAEVLEEIVRRDPADEQAKTALRGLRAGKHDKQAGPSQN